MSANERGAGSALTAFIALGLLAVTALGIWLLGWTHSLRKAHDAADLAALAGADAVAAGRDGCATARGTADRNGARLEHCSVDGAVTSFVLHVEVSVPLRPDLSGRLPEAPRRAHAEAAAGNG